MNIKEVVDRIIVEADVNPAEYTVEARLADVNSEYIILVEKAMQIGSIEPISNAEVLDEVFSIVEGSNTHLRTIKDVPIQRVDYRFDGDSRWCRLELDQTRAINTWCCKDKCCDIRFFVNEKQIFIENGRPGEIRVTYVHGNVPLFTMGDYENINPPELDWLPVVFHDLVWLRPALYQAQYYKTNRVNALETRIERLQTLFDNHYGRNAVKNSQISTDEPINYR